MINKKERESERLDRKIKAVLLDRNFSGAEIERAADISKQVISRYRTGAADIKNIRFETVKKILDYVERLDEDGDGDAYEDLL